MVKETMTHPERVARFERIMELRGGGMTLKQIGQQFDPPLGKQRINQIIGLGRPRPNGRPIGPTRAPKLQRRLAFWQDRRAFYVRMSLPTTVADRRIAALTAELAELAVTD